MCILYLDTHVIVYRQGMRTKVQVTSAIIPYPTIFQIYRDRHTLSLIPCLQFREYMGQGIVRYLIGNIHPRWGDSFCFLRHHICQSCCVLFSHNLLYISVQCGVDVNKMNSTSNPMIYIQQSLAQSKSNLQSQNFKISYTNHPYT